MEEMGSGNELQKQKKGLWSSGERRVKGMCLRGKWGGQEWCGCAPKTGENTGASTLRAFKGEGFREDPRENLTRIFISFLSVLSELWSMQLVLRTAMAKPVWFGCFSGHRAETQWRPRCVWCESEPHCPCAWWLFSGHLVYSPSKRL